MISQHTIKAAIPLPGHYEDRGHWADQGSWKPMDVPTVLYTQDFETSLGGWTATTGRLLATAAGLGHSGCGAANATEASNPPGDTVRYTMAGLTVGRTYRLAAWGRMYGTLSNGLRVGVLGIGMGAWADSNNVWTEYTYTFTATSTSHTLVLEKDAGAASNYAFWDDISLVATTYYDVNTVWVPDLVWVESSVGLDVVDASITLDESWSPYVRAELTCWLPELDSLDEIDPRRHQRVRIRLHQSFVDARPVSAISSSVLANGPTTSPSELLPNPSFATATTGWTGSNATLARVTTPVHTASGALRITATAAGTAIAMTASGASAVPVSPNKTYWVGCYVRSAATSRTVTLKVTWYTTAGSIISTVTAAVGTDNTSGWTAVGGYLTAPATAGRAAVRVEISSAAASEIHYLDSVSLRSHGYIVGTLSAMWSGERLSGVSADLGAPYNSFGIRPSTSRSLDLVLRSREIDHATGTMRLVAASDESLLQDYARVATTGTTAGSTSVRAICAWVLSMLGLTLYPGTADGVVADSTWLPGQSAWDYLRPLVDKAGLRLWCDERRNFYLTNPKDATDGGMPISGTRVTQATDTVDLGGDWYDAVVLTYRWRDATGNDQTAYDVAKADGYSKVRSITYDRPYPGPGAAAAMLARMSGRGRSQSIDAVSDYSAAPGMAVTVTLPKTPIQTGLLSSVTWRVPDDEMTVKTRDLTDTPLTSWFFARPGLAWNEIPAGTDWTEYVNDWKVE